MPPGQIVFVDASPGVALVRCAADWETRSGDVLRPASPERLLLQTVVSEVSRARAAVNDAANGVLLPAARGAALDALAQLVGLTRRVPQAARVVLRFHRAAGVAGAVAVPAGTAALAGGRRFRTLAAAQIAAAEPFADVAAEAVEAGPASNKYLPGQVKTLDGPVAGVARVENVTETAGGTNLETDDELRARVPEALATMAGGTAAAYRAAALAAHPDVDAVGIFSPRAGLVRVVPLGRGGVVLPLAVRNAVAAAVQADTVRAVCDEVAVALPVDHPAVLRVVWQGERRVNADLGETAGSVALAVDAYVRWQTGALGRDIRPSRLVAAVQAVPGVASVLVSAPGANEMVADDALVRFVSVETVFGGVIE